MANSLQPVPSHKSCLEPLRTGSGTRGASMLEQLITGLARRMEQVNDEQAGNSGTDLNKESVEQFRTNSLLGIMRAEHM